MEKQERKLSDYLQKIAQWQILMKALKLENSGLKDRLSITVHLETKVQSIDEAECFQQTFIEKDQVMDFLRQDINHLLEVMSRNGLTADCEERFLSLENDMGKLKIEFERMKRSFYDFLSKKN